MLTWFRKNTKGIMIAVAVVFLGSMFYGLGYQGMKGDSGGSSKTTDIAKVNGEKIDPLRFREIMNRVMMGLGQGISAQDLPFVENLALGQAVDFTLMLNEAKKKVKVSGKEVDAAIEGIMRQQKISSKKDLEAALKRAGLPFDQFKGLIRDEIMVQKFMIKLREEVKVTADDLKELRASHILISTESEAKEVLEQLQKGGDFAALAKKVSQDPGSAAKGGDLGYFTAGSMVPAFEQAAFRLKTGETSGIVKTQFGYHIIKLADSRLRKLPKGEQDIEKAVLKEKQEKSFRQWYMTVKSAAKIEILSPELKGHDLRFKGRAAEALAEYKKAAQAEPTNPYLHVYMGDTYLALGQKGLAIAEYENAIKVQGGDPGLYLILGNAYQKMGEVKMAAEQYRKASLVASDNKDMHQRLLKIFLGMKRPAEVAMEQKEIQRIEKKERFEKELTGGK